MKTFLCWGISKLEALPALLIWPIMVVLSLKDQELTESGTELVIFAMFSAAIPAILTAIYAVKNFEEVTSYSLLFYSSNTDLLDSKIRYFFRTMFAAGLCWAMVIFMCGTFFI